MTRFFFYFNTSQQSENCLVLDCFFFIDIGHRPSSCVVRPLSSLVCEQFYIMYFLKTTRPFIGLKHVYERRNLNCKNRDFTSPGSHGRGKIWKKKKQIFKKSFLLPHMQEKQNIMHIYDVNEALYQMKVSGSGFRPQSRANMAIWGIDIRDFSDAFFSHPNYELMLSNVK